MIDYTLIICKCQGIGAKSGVLRKYEKEKEGAACAFFLLMIYAVFLRSVRFLRFLTLR